MFSASYFTPLSYYLHYVKSAVGVILLGRCDAPQQRANAENTKNNKSLSIMLIDEDDGFEVDLKDGVGQGVRTIISFVLKSYYLLNQNSKVLFLDEKYSALSAHYVPRFYDFIKKFCEVNDFIIVMISHIDNQIEHADYTYYLNDGVISKEEN